MQIVHKLVVFWVRNFVSPWNNNNTVSTREPRKGKRLARFTLGENRRHEEGGPKRWE